MDAALRNELVILYRDLDAEIARRAPVCRISGRCCRFDEYGHTLFLAGVEAERLIEEAPPPSRPLDDGATCPWQDERGRCQAREARPLGCRVYFCDPNYEDQAPEVSEAFLARLRRIVDDHGREWNYAPLHRHLRDAREEGRFERSTPRE